MLVEGEDLWSFDTKKKLLERIDFYNQLPEIEQGVRGGSLSKDGLLWFFKGKIHEKQRNFKIILYLKIFKTIWFGHTQILI